MDKINDLLGPALTAMQAPAMKALPISMAKVDWQFETFGDPRLTAMLSACQNFANEMKSGMPPRWLTLTGRSGIGKTHLVRRLYRWFDQFQSFYRDTATGARIGRPGKRVGWRDAATAIRQGDWNYVTDLCEFWFVVLDDIGAEHQGGTGIVQSTLERVLDARSDKWTVITSNLPQRAIAEQIDVRVASRLIRNGSVIVEAPQATDFNLRKRVA